MFKPGFYNIDNIKKRPRYQKFVLEDIGLIDKMDASLQRSVGHMQIICWK